jgi:HTH-type transcriptional regulator / antitoxin HipB
MDLATIDTSQSLGATIRRRRVELGLSQSALADVARTTLRFVSELENGKSSAQLDGVLRVLAALGIELVARQR